MIFNSIISYKKGDYITMKPLKEKVSITLDSDIVQKIKEFAEKDDRSFSQYVNLILRKWIVANEQIDNQ